MKKMHLFAKDIQRWYRKEARDLPWRKTSDPYKIWISEIMLQQTTVTAGIPYFEKWIHIFPTVYDVAKATEDQILKVWQGLGYYSRAKNIYKTAKIIVDEFDGKIPSNPEALQSLPGFGPYTVGAVLSIAFDIRYPIIDANVRRVIMRILEVEGRADQKKDKVIYEYLEEVLPYKDIKSFNQALMELGALVCRNKNPLCLQCPVRLHCVAFSKGTQELIPEKHSKKIIPIQAVIAVIERDQKFYIQKRTAKGLLNGLWEFPGGKIEKGESQETALKREVKEEIQATIKTMKHMMDAVHYYTQYKVSLNVWKCKVNEDLVEDQNHKWVERQDLLLYAMPSGSTKIVDKLLKK